MGNDLPETRFLKHNKMEELKEFRELQFKYFDIYGNKLAGTKHDYLIMEQMLRIINELEAQL